jgi:chloramphenicol-sensitive protein RarD
LALAVLAYGLWGVSPLYFKMLAGIDPIEVLAHRVLGAVPLLFVILAVRRGFPSLFGLVRRPRILASLLGTSALIGVNWGFYVLAVTTDRLAEASLGYFLNPLVNVLLGWLVLGERLSVGARIAVVLAMAGTGWYSWTLGGLPWISLVLAVTFALYGLWRKVLGVGALEGLAIETALLAPLAVAWLVSLAMAGTASLGQDPGDAWLLLAGVVTTAPLLAFVGAARRLPLQVLGFVQYLSPTMQLALAVLLYREPFDPSRAVSFLLVGAAVAVFLVDLAVRRSR